LDCQSNVCTGGICSQMAATCTDKTKDGSETDVDCGGDACLPCRAGKQCMKPTDCTLDMCVNNICAPDPICSNHVQDRTEPDIDCGGPLCLPCTTGKRCIFGTDCVSNACNHMTCS